MDKHTPGPWTVTEATNYFGITGKTQVARTSISPQSPDQRVVGLANARLIAAAPELLDALKGAQEIAGLIRELDDCLPSERVGLETELEAIEEAINAAISKAESPSR